MVRAIPLVHDDRLLLPDEGDAPALTVGEPAWFAWLEEATSFAFRGLTGSFTARKERAGHGRGGWYWKAYRRREGRLRRTYLGQSADLTLDRLRAAAAALAAGGDERPAEEADPPRAAPGPRAADHPAPPAPAAAPSALAGAGMPWIAPPRVTIAPRLNHLPVPGTALIGREQQVAAVRRCLLHDQVRLLVLTGPGGVGKTRLALHAAGELREHFADGVCFVSLAAITDAALVADALAQALGVSELPGRSVVEALADMTRERAILLVLDNFEQVAAAAPLLADLLAASPRLAILVTSRAVLNLYGEHDLPVPPLTLPGRPAAGAVQQVGQAEAVQLFVARARAARPDFALSEQNAAGVAELCQRLDGLPLAIELAAARLRSLPLPTLLARMERRLPLLTGGPRDLPARQQTLRDTIAWSHDLLDADEQSLFRRLAVFRGATLDAIEAVCCRATEGAGSASISLPPLTRDALDGVTSLVDRNLLRQEEAPDGHARWVMLETVREFALERLAASGEEAAVQRRHILYFLALAEAAEPELSTGPDQAAWTVRVKQEHDNLRSALTWCEERGYAEPAFRMTVALWWFWAVHGHVGEGRERLARLLARFPLRDATSKHGPRYAQALRTAGMLALAQGDHAAARRSQQEGLHLQRHLGDRIGLYNALLSLGMTATLQGDHAAAEAYLEEALAIARALDDPEMVAWGAYHLGVVVHARGDHAAAWALLEGIVAPDPRHGLESRRGIAHGAAFYQLAVIARDQAEPATARWLISVGIDAYRQQGYRRNVADGLVLLASIAITQKDEAAAEEALATSLGIHQELDNPLGIAHVLERYAALAAARGWMVRAVRVAAAAAALWERIGIVVPPDVRARLDDVARTARHALGQAVTDAAWAGGQALSLEEAVALAIAPPEPAPAPADAAPASTASPLTRREREVAALIARGHTNRQIAAALFITEGTVANHVVHILNKLGHESRTQIAVWAAQQGLLTPSDA